MPMDALGAGTERLSHHPRRIAHRCPPLGQRFQHDGARTYLAAAAYGNVTQDRRIAPDEHVVAYFGMAVAFFLPSGAQDDAGSKIESILICVVRIVYYKKVVGSIY